MVCRRGALPIGGSVVAGALVVVLVHSAMAFARGRAELSLVERELERLTRRSAYPSTENLKELEDERDALAFMISELDVSMHAGAHIEGVPDAAVFSARAQAAIERYQARITGVGIVVPDELEVGFAAYASGGAVPDVLHVPRLMRQLDAVERVLDLLLEAEVASIDALERERFEFSPNPPQENEGAEGECIRVGFTAEEGSVWRALELFGQPARLLEVVEISHRTQSDMLRYEVSEKQTTDPAVSEDQMFEGDAALSRSERIVAGGEWVRVELVLIARRLDGRGP